jgi:hypothetical protein
MTTSSVHNLWTITILQRSYFSILPRSTMILQILQSSLCKVQTAHSLQPN